MDIYIMIFAFTMAVVGLILLLIAYPTMIYGPKEESPKAATK